MLEVILLGDPPAESGWSKTELERAIQSERGGVDRLLAGANALGLLEQAERRWRRPGTPAEIAKPLRELLLLTRDFTDVEIPPLPKRPYKQSATSSRG